MRDNGQEQEPQLEDVIIELSGESGNAFYILGMVKKCCDKTGQDWDAINKEMTSGDYNNLIAVVEKHFDNFIFV